MPSRPGNHWNFNPHFREGSDSKEADLLCKEKISIHTSAKEVTVSLASAFKGFTISIHTSAKEVTKNARQKSGTLPYFNPHFREGSDPETADCRPAGPISIHTSAKEVTLYELLRVRQIAISIHTSAKEVTASALGDYNGLGHFNPHFREGSDMTLPQNLKMNYYFNPHFREGSDS